MSVTQLIEKHFQTLRSDPQTWRTLWAPDAILEMPYAAAPHPTRVEGIDAIATTAWWFAMCMADDFNVQIKKMYPVEGDDAAFVEYVMVGTVKTTRKLYEQDYISYFRVENGKIVLFREYFDTARVAAAFTTD
ncbi:NTF2-like protein [Trichoderma citrinoviride]|uniref:NTF2-like protein n=1 Tax=Trichoderma citrinoviride TaxID=58853 RepID=A0A2T4B2W9_9HYPO|nr:NTF2-like protein [Trichoderma citrinoviride]PTB63669.1 NTF2-like protein [Trichoderma citrinoviride]